MSTVNRTLKEGNREDIPCPQVIKDYNVHMGHVDKADILKYYEIDQKSKWWHRVKLDFLDVCVVNAYILHKQLHQLEKYPTLKHFCLDIAEGR